MTIIKSEVYEIDLAYSNDGDGIGLDWDLDRMIEALVGRPSDSAGSGFGLRDMQFVFEDTRRERRNLKKAMRRLRKSGIEFEYLSVNEPFEVEEEDFWALPEGIQNGA